MSRARSDIRREFWGWLLTIWLLGISGISLVTSHFMGQLAGLIMAIFLVWPFAVVLSYFTNRYHEIGRENDAARY